MSSKRVMCQNRSKLNKAHINIYTKRMNHTLLVNVRLRKQIQVLSSQNKELSITRNSLLLEKISLENERNPIINANFQLTAMLRMSNEKTKIIEQNLQTCVPALITLSKCIPTMMENVHEISKLDKFNEFNKGKKERLIESVKPIVNSYVIEQPAVRLRPNLNMTPIAERRSESYVRLKDVAALLKNSKAVTNKNSPKRQPDDNIGEGPSWLYTQENPIRNSDNDNNVTKNSKNYSVVLGGVIASKKNEMAATIPDEMATSIVEETSPSNLVQVDVPSSNLSLDSCVSNTFYDNEGPNESFTLESSMLRNITCRKRCVQKSSESSVASDNELAYSLRSRRSVKKINYKEKSIHTKLRRDK